MYQQPDYSQALGSINHLNNDELKELLNDDVKFEEMMKDLKQVYYYLKKKLNSINDCLQKFQFKDLEQEREMLLASISSLSDFNLTKEPQLVESREKLSERSEQGEEISQRVQEKMEELRM